MDTTNNVDITSYIQEYSDDSERPNTRVRQPTARSNLNSNARRSIVPVQSSSRQTTQLYQRPPINNEASREKVSKPSVRRSQSFNTGPERRVTTPAMPNTQRNVPDRGSIPINNHNWTTSLRSGPSTLVPRSSERVPIVQESKTEKLLREELSRLRTSFRDYRNDCFEKMESCYANNASLMEEIKNLRIRLNAVQEDIYSMGSKRPSLKVDKNKLLADLSAALLESPEFKQKVLDLIVERENELMDEEERNDSLLKPMVSKQNTPHSISYHSAFNGNNQTPRHPTIIREETFVHNNSGFNSDDEVDIIEDRSPFAFKQNQGSGDIRPQMPKLQVEQLSNSGDDLLSDHGSNRTFTLSEDEIDDKENSPIAKARPYIERNHDDVFSAHSSRSNGKGQRGRSEAWTLD